MNTNFKVLGLIRLGIKPEFTAPEAGALTTRTSELLESLRQVYLLWRWKGHLRGSLVLAWWTGGRKPLSEFAISLSRDGRIIEKKKSSAQYDWKITYSDQYNSQKFT